MTDKKKNTYENTGLLRIDGIVTINGKGYYDLPEKAQTFIHNTGLYVWITRLAARSKEQTLTPAEMKVEFSEGLAWLMADCPKRTKSTSTPEEKAFNAAKAVIDDLEKNTAELSNAEKKLMASIIEKKKIALKELEAKIVK